MFDFHIQPQILIIPPEGIETVRAGGDDLLDAVGFDLLDILGSHGLVNIFVTQFPLRFTAAFFLLAKDAHFDPGSVADLDKVAGHILVSFIKGGITAGKVEDIHRTAIRHALHIPDRWPSHPGWQTPAQRDCH